MNAISRRAVAIKARRNGKRARRRPEDALQERVCVYLSLQQQLGRLLYFAIPNAGKRSAHLGWMLKKQGMKPGVPDLCIIPKIGPVCFVELKAGDNDTTELQDSWLESLPKFGCAVAVCRSLDDVQQFLFRTGVIREAA